MQLWLNFAKAPSAQRFILVIDAYIGPCKTGLTVATDFIDLWNTPRDLRWHRTFV